MSRLATAVDDGHGTDHMAAAMFQRDPLTYLDRHWPRDADAFWVPGQQLLITEPELARAVLSNGEGLYEEHSDFFHTRRGNFGPRTVQVAMGRDFRRLLQQHLRQLQNDKDSMRRDLLAAHDWPNDGNRLVHRWLANALSLPGRAPEIDRLLEDLVERSVCAGAREQHSWWRRGLFRRRVGSTLKKEIERRQCQGIDTPKDLLDAVAVHGSEASTDDLAEVFLSALFASAGSVGFTLGWCFYLLGTHPTSEDKAEWVVREALRLWPIAWMLARRPTREHRVAGHTVAPDDLVVVCPYLIHRHPAQWTDASSFRPERWAAGDSRAFLPFGWGPHFCAAASLTLDWVADILNLVIHDHRPTVERLSARPQVGPALAPPRFHLCFEPRGSSVIRSSSARPLQDQAGRVGDRSRRSFSISTTDCHERR